MKNNTLCKREKELIEFLQTGSNDLKVRLQFMILKK